MMSRGSVKWHCSRVLSGCRIWPGRPAYRISGVFTMGLSVSSV